MMMQDRPSDSSETPQRTSFSSQQGGSFPANKRDAVSTHAHEEAFTDEDLDSLIDLEDSTQQYASDTRRVPPTAYKDKSANVHGNERIGSGLLGSAFLIWGARRQGLAGTMAIAGGLGLLARAATGQCAVKRALTPSPLSSSIARSQGWTTATVTSAAVTIARPREEIYRLWRDFSRLPEFMKDIEDIEVITPLRSRWTVKAPFGKTMSWTSFVTDDVENERIAWESEAGAEVPNFGSVKFRDAPGGRGTEVSAMIAYQPPFSTAGRLLGAVLRATPEHQMRDNLRRLKQMLETDEIAVSELNANT